MTDRPVLFLDIDGVLNCRAFFKRAYEANPNAPIHGHHGLCPDRMRLLNDVIARSNCLVTVSSTWRRDRNCRNILRRAGFRGAFSKDWRTPSLASIHREPYTERGYEIADWLSRNPTSRYAIVDDDSDMLDDQRARFVQTTFDDGLTEGAAERLVEIMREK